MPDRLITACDGCYAELVIAGVSLNSFGWCFPDYSALLADPDYNGTDRPLPGQADIPYPRFDGRLEVVLVGAIAGDYAGESGLPLQPALTLSAGVLRNIAYLQANVTAPVTTGDGTRSASLIPVTGATRTAAIHAGPLRWSPSGVEGVVNATLRIEVPDGRFS